jgi:hypothetical protein
LTGSAQCPGPLGFHPVPASRHPFGKAPPHHSRVFGRSSHSTSMHCPSHHSSFQAGRDTSGHCRKFWTVTPSPDEPVQPGHAVVGPHREQNCPVEGSSGVSTHAGRSAGPRPWKSQPQCSAQTGPIRDPESPNQGIPVEVPVGAPLVPVGLKSRPPTLCVLVHSPAASGVALGFGLL